MRPKSEVVREALAYLEDHGIHLMIEWAFDGDQLPPDVEQLLNDVIASCVPYQEEIETKVCEIIEGQYEPPT